MKADMGKILCIGASTYNEETPNQINDALIKTDFLDEWAVIIAIHNYFRLYAPNICEIKQTILSKHFESSPVTLVDQVQDYVVQSGNIYVLPDSMYCQEKQICTKIEEKNQSIIIMPSNSENSISETFQWIEKRSSCSRNLDDDYYLPCIDKTMTELSQIKLQKSAGLILAGMGKDGAEGLTNIAKFGGHIAIQNPDECFAERAKKKDTSSMPREAIKQATKNKVHYQTVELNQQSSLVSWLQSIK